jgi:hypothetical protein
MHHVEGNGTDELSNGYVNRTFPSLVILAGAKGCEWILVGGSGGQNCQTAVRCMLSENALGGDVWRGRFFVRLQNGKVEGVSRNHL